MKHLILMFAFFAISTNQSQAQTLTINNFLHCAVIGVEIYVENGSCGPGSYTATLELIEVAETVILDFTNPASVTGTSALIRWTNGTGWISSVPTGPVKVVGVRVFNPGGVTPGICGPTGFPYDEIVVGDLSCGFNPSGTFSFETTTLLPLPPSSPNTWGCNTCTGGGTVSNANVAFTITGTNWDVTITP